MPRPLEHGDVVGFRLSSAMHQTLETAAASLGVSKSEFVRAIVLQALRHELIARAAFEEFEARPAYPQFVSATRRGGPRA